MRSTTTKRTLEVTVETNEIFIVRHSPSLKYEWCDGCDGESGMVPAETAAKLLGIRARVVYRQIEDGKVHFYEHEGTVFVCLDSLRTGNSSIETTQRTK